MDMSARPSCSVTVKSEPEERDMDLPFKTSLKTEEVDVEETVIQELVPEFPDELKYSPPVDLSTQPLCSVTVKCEQEKTDTDLSFTTSPKTEEDELESEMPDDVIDGNSSDGTSPNCASDSLPSSTGGIEELPMTGNVWASKDELIAACFPICCSRGQDRFENKSQLKRHLHQLCSLKGEVIAPYCCLLCKSRFQNMCQLRGHLHSDHHIKCDHVIFSCSVCSKIYSKRRDFMKHILELHPRVNIHVCPICKETFHSCWDLHDHLSKYSNDDSYSCPRCDLMFPTRTTLELHMQSCTVCSIKFYNRSALNRHIKSHTERILTCDICYKSYSKRHAFAQHISTHSNDVQLDCPKCEKKFANPSSLTNHLQVHKLQRPFTCKTCNKVFLQRSHLVGHMAIHNRVQSFTCFMCRKSFTRLYDLEKHEEIHREGQIWTMRRQLT